MTPATVLLVDDDPVTVRVLTTDLRHEGFHVIVAVDALQAVMFAHRNVPDAILLDVNLPGGSGLEVLKRLRASSETQLIPVIAMSTSKDPDLPGRAMALGAEAFLPKPVDLTELGGLIRRLLDGGSPG